MRLAVICPWGKSAPPMVANQCVLIGAFPYLSCRDVAGTPGGHVPPDPNAGAWEFEVTPEVAAAVLANPQLAPCVVYCDELLPPDEPPTQDGFDAAVTGLASLLKVTSEFVQSVVGTGPEGRTRREITNGSVLPFLALLRKAGAPVVTTDDEDAAVLTVATAYGATETIIRDLLDPVADCPMALRVRAAVRDESRRLADSR
jgi:hypothetical protein